MAAVVVLTSVGATVVVGTSVVVGAGVVDEIGVPVVVLVVSLVAVGGASVEVVEGSEVRSFDVTLCFELWRRLLAFKEFSSFFPFAFGTITFFVMGDICIFSGDFGASLIAY